MVAHAAWVHTVNSPNYCPVIMTAAQVRIVTMSAAQVRTVTVSATRVRIMTVYAAKLRHR